MKASELIKHLTMGREIEFSLNSHPYFMSSCSSTSNDSDKYYIWDCINKQDIFIGTIEELLAFKFPGNISFTCNIDEFFFEYIL